MSSVCCIPWWCILHHVASYLLRCCALWRTVVYTGDGPYGVVYFTAMLCNSIANQFSPSSRQYHTYLLLVCHYDSVQPPVPPRCDHRQLRSNQRCFLAVIQLSECTATNGASSLWSNYAATNGASFAWSTTYSNFISRNTQPFNRVSCQSEW